MTKEDISKIIDKIRSKKEVKVLLKGSKDKSPKPISFHDSRRSYVPDFVAVHPKHHDYYAVEKNITAANLPELIGKWILFSLHARQLSGTFFLIVDGEKEGRRCQAIIDKKKLSVELIVIK